MSWGCVGFHPIQKIPKRDFWDGALVGVGLLKPCSSKSTISLQPRYHQFFVNSTF
jgi:hypothetical protein